MRQLHRRKGQHHKRSHIAVPHRECHIVARVPHLVYRLKHHRQKRKERKQRIESAVLALSAQKIHDESRNGKSCTENKRQIGIYPCKYRRIKQTLEYVRSPCRRKILCKARKPYNSGNQRRYTASDNKPRRNALCTALFSVKKNVNAEIQYREQYHHIAEIIIQHQHSDKAEYKTACAFTLYERIERYQQQREEVHYIEPYRVLIEQHRVTAERIHNAEKRRICHIQLFMAGAEVRICSYRTDSHFHKRHNVHEQHHVRFVDKCNKKRKRA